MAVNVLWAVLWLNSSPGLHFTRYILYWIVRQHPRCIENQRMFSSRREVFSLTVIFISIYQILSARGLRWLSAVITTFSLFPYAVLDFWPRNWTIANWREIEQKINIEFRFAAHSTACDFCKRFTVTDLRYRRPTLKLYISPSYLEYELCGTLISDNVCFLSSEQSSLRCNEA